MKTKYKIISHIFFSLLLALTIFLTDCGGVSSGPGTATDNPELAPPAPPPQFPSFVRFPSSIAQIKVDELIVGGTVGAFASFSIGEDVSDLISSITSLTGQHYSVVDAILEQLHQLEIPVGYSPTFEGLISIRASQIFNVKIDFRDFENRNCSGHTAALPICYRIWMNGERSLYGQFDTFPTETNAGNGDIAGSVPFIIQTGEFLTGGLSSFFLHYELEDELTKEIEIGAVFEANIQDQDYLSHFAIKQEPLEDSLQKTIFYTGTLNTPQNLDEQIFRWLDNNEYLSGVVQSSEDPPETPTEPFCALIATNIVVDQENCTAQGSDVSDLEFLSPVDFDDFGYPPDFPIAPTF